jgi:SAM-dependent methyltransferase
MSELERHELRNEVREAYTRVAEGSVGGCGTGGCCGSAPNTVGSERLGYSAEEMAAVPAGADLGLGCGNPQAIAALKPGETVLDLGSGAGFDCFLAARAVGEQGRVIGVDMTPAMITKARGNALKGDYRQVEFRLGEIEALPVADASVDVIISNCVINLSTDKARVFRETFRALKPGGRLAISDVVATAELPAEARRDLALYSGCMAGASVIAELESMMRAAGFDQISIQPKDASREFIRDWAPGRGVEAYVASATIEAIKPADHGALDELRASIVSMVSLAAGIAANHPAMGLCQVEKLRGLGVPAHHIETVVEIARHLRDEAAQRLDADFDAKATTGKSSGKPLPIKVADAGAACCSTTPSGKPCC